MTAERDVLLSLLKLTQAGPVNRALLAKTTRATGEAVERALAKFEQSSLFDEYRGVIEVSLGQRVRIAIRAFELGADLERVCHFLSWAEFEAMAAQAFEGNGYRAVRNFRLKHGEKRWEIDVLGLKEPWILCADCKHWGHGLRSAAALKTVEAQVERTKALADALPRYLHKIGLDGWRAAVLIPLVVSLLPGNQKLYNQVPIVPVLQLQDFISEIPLTLDLLLHINKNIKLISGEIDRFF